MHIRPNHDLKLVALAIAIVAAFGQRAGATLTIGRGNVVKTEGAVLEVAPRQCAFDALLLAHQPVERLVKLLLVNTPEHAYAQPPHRPCAISRKPRRED